MKLNTQYFGEIEVGEKDIIHFTDGILAFESLKRYVYIPIGEEQVFNYLQCVDEPDLAFIVMEPWSVFKDYDFNLPPEIMTALEVEKAEEVAVLTIVTVGEDVKQMTTNLVAPLVINIRTNKAAQVVLNAERYHTKHSILSATSEVAAAK